MRHNRNRDLLALTALAALIASPISGASAQRRPPEPPPRLMIPTLSSPDKDLGQQAAEALRSRISRDVNNQKLIVIPKADIENTLKASGYSTTESLQLNDANKGYLTRMSKVIGGEQGAAMAAIVANPADAAADAVLAGRRRAPLERALLGIAAAALQEELERGVENLRPPPLGPEMSRPLARLWLGLGPGRHSYQR